MVREAAKRLYTSSQVDPIVALIALVMYIAHSTQHDESSPAHAFVGRVHHHAA